MCVLRMLEDSDFHLRDLTLDNPARAIRDISHDITCRKKVKLANGKEWSALEIQQELLQKAISFSETRGFNNEEQRALEMWRHCISTIADDPLKLSREVDWVIKYHLIEGFMSRHQLPLDDAKTQMLDIQYHDIKRDRGVFYGLQDQGMVESICLPSDIEQAKSHPPQSTRAKLRGDFIRQAKIRKRDFTVDWVHLKLNDETPKTVVCKDPFQSVDDRVQRLIDTL
jgi:proteasome accessory factor A